MTLTDKLLKRTEQVTPICSFLYVSDAAVEDKAQWIAFIENTVKAESPDFVFFANAETANQTNIDCRKITEANAPLSVSANGVTYAVVGNKAHEDVAQKEDALCCVYGSCKHDYAIKENGIWYMNTAASEKGGIRKVSVTADGELISEVVYFVDKTEKVYKANWKTVLLSRGGQGRPMADSECIYVPTATSGVPKNCGVYKLGAKGGILWKFPTENSVVGDLAQTDDTVMAVDCEGNVYFIAKDGSGLKGKLKLAYHGRYAKAETVYYGSMAYISLKGQIYAIDMKKQAVIWQYDGEGCKTAIPVISGNRIFAKGQKGLFALCAETGAFLWENTFAVTSAKPLSLVDGRLILPCGDRILLLDGETGGVMADLKVNGVCFDVPSQPLLRGKTLYAGTVSKGVVAVEVGGLMGGDSSEAEITAAYPVDCGEKTVTGDITYIDGHIVFSTADGFTYMTNIYTAVNRKSLDTLSAVSSSPEFIRVKKQGRNAMEAYLVTSSLSGKIFGNRL